MSPSKRAPTAIAPEPVPVDSAPDDPDHLNLALVVGTLSSEPRRSELPSGSVLVAYEVSTPGPDGRRESVPVTWLDPRRPAALHADDEVVISGRVRRRFFRAGGATASRTEIVAEVVARAGSARAERAVAAVAARLASGGSR